MKYVWSHRVQDHFITIDDVEGVEIDVRFTKDHSPVLIHDPLYNEKPISEYMTSEIIGKLLLLDDFLTATQPYIINIMIEVKASSLIDLDSLYKCIVRHHDRSIVIASFDEHCLQYFSQYSYPLMYLTCNRWIQIPLLIRNKIRYIGLSVDVLTIEYIMWLRNELVHTEIFLFTLNDEKVWKWIVDSFPHLMIDGIITDRPSECKHFFSLCTRDEK